MSMMATARQESPGDGGSVREVLAYHASLIPELPRAVARGLDLVVTVFGGIVFMLLIFNPEIAAKVAVLDLPTIPRQVALVPVLLLISWELMRVNHARVAVLKTRVDALGALVDRQAVELNASASELSARHGDQTFADQLTLLYREGVNMLASGSQIKGPSDFRRLVEQDDSWVNRVLETMRAHPRCTQQEITSVEYLREVPLEPRFHVIRHWNHRLRMINLRLRRLWAVIERYAAGNPHP